MVHFRSTGKTGNPFYLPAGDRRCKTVQTTTSQLWKWNCTFETLNSRVKRRTQSHRGYSRRLAPRPTSEPVSVNLLLVSGEPTVCLHRTIVIGFSRTEHDYCFSGTTSGTQISASWDSGRTNPLIVYYKKRNYLPTVEGEWLVKIVQLRTDTRVTSSSFQMTGS